MRNLILPLTFFAATCLAGFLSSGASAQYQQQAEYFRMLRSPLMPTAGNCRSLDVAFVQARQRVSQEHEKCLGRSSNGHAGSTCSKAGCQGLHNLMDYAAKRASYEKSVCHARLSSAQEEQRRQDQQARATQASRQQLANDQARQEELSRSTSQARNKSASFMGSGVERVWDDPRTQASVENLKNSTGAAAASGVDDVRPGLRAPAIGSIPSAATTVGGVLIQLGVGLLNPETATGVQKILERRGGRHPADKIIKEDEAQYQPKDDEAAAQQTRRDELRDALRPR